MRERRYKAGDTVTQEGSGGAGFFVVEEGVEYVGNLATASVAISPAPFRGVLPLPIAAPISCAACWPSRESSRCSRA